MGLEVIQPGLVSTVQDGGRTGYRAFGVPLGGAFDRGSAELANALLGNPPGLAVLEMTLIGGTYEARVPLALALAGAPFIATIRCVDGRESSITVPRCFPLEGGDRLILGRSSRGARAYMAVLGGWQTPVVLGSRSNESPLSRGDVLPCRPGWTPVRYPDPVDFLFAATSPALLRVIDGPDIACLGDKGLDDSRIYRVGTQCDRMGLRLEGRSWEVVSDPDRVSTPLTPGAIQAAGGRPLVLGVACGTMGGYPHVAHVISADLDRLGQVRPGDAVRFERVTLAEARVWDREALIVSAARRARIATAAGDRPFGVAPGTSD